ncbi:MAG: amidohydrolase family protein [Candidatus Heimdallarchaeota archaeon]|nr:amidohydrolase family protein [Candidatus Heimdallarchaeota archaeon]
MDYAIINTKLLTFQGNNLGIIDNGGLGFEEGKISFVGEMSDFNYHSASQVIDGSKHITMPGLINAHTHTGLTLLRGGAQDLPEIEWMNKGIGPLSRHMTSDDLIIGSKLGVVEGLISGTTTFCEYASNVDKLVDEVYLPFNTRVIATETINEISPKRDHLKPTDLYEFDRKKGEQSLKQANQLFSKYKNTELVTCMFGPQALDMISFELLREVKEEAIKRESHLHMHVAQGERERLQIKGRYGSDSTTIRTLDKFGFLDETLLAVHCHDTTVQERELMVKQGVKMVCCPNSISMIDGVVPPVGHYVQLGGKVGLGSDQAPGPGLHNMFSEMRSISILTKTMNKDPTVLPAWEVLQLGTKSGAQILGLDKKIGSLEVGKQADVIMINHTHPNLSPVVTKPFRTYIPNIVYSATGYEIDNVFIQGKEIIINKKFVSIDIEELVKEANKRAERIFNDATEDWKHADSKLVKHVEKGFL